MLLDLIMWIIYGTVVGVLAKAIHSGAEPQGFFSTILIGILGSFVGGFINYALGLGTVFQPSGILMGVVGGVITCYAYSKLKK